MNREASGVTPRDKRRSRRPTLLYSRVPDELPGCLRLPRRWIVRCGSLLEIPSKRCAGRIVDPNGSISQGNPRSHHIAAFETRYDALPGAPPSQPSARSMLAPAADSLNHYLSGIRGNPLGFQDNLTPYPRAPQRLRPRFCRIRGVRSSEGKRRETWGPLSPCPPPTPSYFRSDEEPYCKLGPPSRLFCRSTRTGSCLKIAHVQLAVDNVRIANLVSRNGTRIGARSGAPYGLGDFGPAPHVGASQSAILLATLEPNDGFREFPRR